MGFFQARILEWSAIAFSEIIKLVMALEPKKIKSVTVSIVSPSICHKVMGPDAIILVF